MSADGNEGSLPDSLTIISDMMNLYELKRKPVWQMNGEELLELQRLAAPQRVESAEGKERRRQGRKSYSMPKRYLKR